MNPKIESVLALPPDKRQAKQATKAVEKESASITAVMGTQETPLLVAHNSGLDNDVLVVTDQRSFTIKRGKVRRELAHHEVHSTRLAVMPRGTILVGIDSHVSVLDYAPNDSKRFMHIVQVEVATPRIANMICALIDARLG